MASETETEIEIEMETETEVPGGLSCGLTLFHTEKYIF